MLKVFDRGLRRNLVSTVIWQGASYLVPLITLPYLTRVLGLEQFGIMALVLAIISYMILLTDWGFSLTATQRIAANREDPAALNRIFWSTLFAKTLLCLVPFIGMCIAMAVIPRLGDLSLEIVCGYVQVACSVITVNWYLQGMERLGKFATAALIGRLATVPLTFLLVRSSADTDLAILIQGLGALLSGLASLYFARATGRLRRPHVSPRDIWHELRDGWHVFVSTAAISMYTQATSIILGAVAGVGPLGLFSGADRIRRAAQQTLQPIQTAFYPRLAYNFAHDRPAAHRLLRFVLLAQGAVTLCISFILLFFADLVVRLLLGVDFAPAATVLRIMAPIPVLVGISGVLGIMTMIPLGLKAQLSRILLAAGVLNLLLIVPASYYLGAAGAALTVLVTESVVTGTMIVFLALKRRRPQPGYA